MDYTVGSLSDLITGSNTANKKKVIKKKVISKPPAEEPVVKKEKTKGFTKKSKGVTFPKAVKKRKFAAKTETEETGAKPSKKGTVKLEENEDTGASPPKKRKIKAETGASSPKKSKNAENAERRVTNKEKPVKEDEDPELVARTVYVGNLPITSDTSKLKKLFSQYGKVDSLRIRGVPVANPKTPKKVAFIKKEFHPERKSFYAFVRFEEREGAQKAAEANGMLFKEHHLRIHMCDSNEKPDENKAIFVGNLSFYAEENDLWKIFEPCGSISSVRIVRDSKTGMGKGFGYVNFENSDSVTLAMEMETVKLKDRELRINICNINAAKKNKKVTKPKKAKKPRNRNKPTGDDESGNTEKKVGDKSFQGAKFVAKKQKKFNKGLIQKRVKAKQIAPK